MQGMEWESGELAWECRKSGWRCKESKWIIWYSSRNDEE